MVVTRPRPKRSLGIVGRIPGTPRPTRVVMGQGNPAAIEARERVAAGASLPGGAEWGRESMRVAIAPAAAG